MAIAAAAGLKPTASPVMLISLVEFTLSSGGRPMRVGSGMVISLVVGSAVRFCSLNTSSKFQFG
ncbi:hypothetical protein D9M69_475150 [compost metagenome]